MLKLFLTLLFFMMIIYPARSEDRSLSWGLSILKDISGVIGAAEACNNRRIHADAIRVYRSALKALVQNGVIPEEDVSYIINMNAKTALIVKKDFLRDAPVSCTDISEVWLKIKDDLGI